MSTSALTAVNRWLEWDIEAHQVTQVKVADAK